MLDEDKFTISELARIEGRAERMAESVSNPHWKRAYLRLSDSASEMIARLLTEKGLDLEKARKIITEDL